MDEADALKSAPIEMLDVLRTTVPLEGCDDWDVVQQIPVGTEGTVVDVYGAGEAFEVDLDLFNDPGAPEHFVTVTMTVDAGQCELAWKCPRKAGEKPAGD